MASCYIRELLLYVEMLYDKLLYAGDMLLRQVILWQHVTEPYRLWTESIWGVYGGQCPLLPPPRSIQNIDIKYTQYRQKVYRI